MIGGRWLNNRRPKLEQAKIAAAFVKAKREFAPALKTSINPHFKSKYADLAACIEAVDQSFLNNGIAMYQETFEDVQGVTVETVLLHESGEQLRCGKLHVPASKADAQGYGSALTYVRRYSLMAACGIAPEDDDGNAATKAPPTKTEPLPMDAKTLALREADLLACADLMTLKAAFAASWKLADDDGREKLKAAYESRKAILEAKHPKETA